MDNNHLHQPLMSLPTSATTITTTSSPRSRATTNGDLPVRLLLIILICSVSIWASNEASKGFSITVINDMKNTPTGEKFSLFYVSNDEATRLVQGAANFAIKILYPTGDGLPGKLIDQVDIHLANHNLGRDDQMVVLGHHGSKNKYVVSISSEIMEYYDFRYRIRKGIQRCMAEILVSSQKNTAPKALRDGIVEYISNQEDTEGPKPVVNLVDFGRKCWEAKEPNVVAQFLGYGEREKEGFIGRLNQLMRDGWDDEIVDKALGMQGEHLCKSFRFTMAMNDSLVST